MHNGFGVHTAEGVLGGALGTLFLSGATRVTRRLPEELKPVTLRRDPAEWLLQRLEEFARRPLPWVVHEGLAQGLHWAHWVACGGLLGLATTRVRIRTIGEAARLGAGMGAAVWAVEYAGVLPLARLTPPVYRQGARHVAASLLQNIACGVVCALPIYAVERMRRRRSWAQRALDAITR